MARKITVTAAELDALRFICERSGIYDETKEGAAKMKALGKLLQKAEKAHAPSPHDESAAATFGALESVLLNIAGNKVVKLGRLTAREYAMISRDIKERGVTEDQMRTLAQWLRRQAWMKGTVTLVTVLKYWGAWYGKAEAEAARGVRAVGNRPAPLIGAGEELDEDAESDE